MNCCDFLRRSQAACNHWRTEWPVSGQARSGLVASARSRGEVAVRPDFYPDSCRGSGPTSLIACQNEFLLVPFTGEGAA